MAIAALHLLCAMLAIVSASTNDGGAGYLTLAKIDVPLLLMWYWVVGTNPAEAMFGYMMYCTIAGSIMYGFAGALLGLVIDVMRRGMRPTS